MQYQDLQVKQIIYYYKPYFSYFSPFWLALEPFFHNSWIKWVIPRDFTHIPVLEQQDQQISRLTHHKVVQNASEVNWEPLVNKNRKLFEVLECFGIPLTQILCS